MDKNSIFKTARIKTSPRTRGGSLFKNVSTESPDIVNADKYPAFSEKLNWKYGLTRLMLCSFIQNTFYTSKEDQVREAKRLLEIGREADPDFVLKLSKFARDQNRKLIVKLGLIAVSGTDAMRYEKTIVDILSGFHPGQLIEYIEILKGKPFGKGLGYKEQRLLRKAIERWGDSLVEEYTLKYRKDFKKVIKLTHPKPKPLFGYLFNKTRAFGNKQKSLEELKHKVYNSKISPDEFGKRIIEANIPWDAVKAFAPAGPRSALAMMLQMGTQALLLNTASFARKGIFDLPNVLNYYSERLSIEALRKARINPIDVVKPLIKTKNLYKSVYDVLVKVYTDSFNVEIPGLDKYKVSVAIDQSGSMSDLLLHAGSIAGVIIKNCNSPWVCGYDCKLWNEGELVDFETTPRLPFLTNVSNEEMVSRIFSLKSYTSTNTALPILEAMNQNREIDLFINITDETQNTGRTEFFKAAQTYHKKYPNSKFFIINVSPYPWHGIPENDYCFIFNTIDSQIFNVISFLSNDRLVDQIDKQVTLEV